MNNNKFSKALVIAALMVSLLSCKKEDESSSNSTWTITIESFTLDNGTYTTTGKELVFDSKEECQIWNRTAQSDSHDSNAHLHYNAAGSVSYENSSITFSWTEYGPEIDQATLENICSNEDNGVNKTVNDNSYYQDKPNLYLKIVSVVEN